MTDETLPLDAYCKTCVYGTFTDTISRLCISPSVLRCSMVLRVDEDYGCPEYKPQGEEK